MKELQFEYSMKLSFAPPVENHRFTLKCIPLTTGRQEISELHADVFPKEFLSHAEDSFGNLCIYGHAQEKHDLFSALVTGRARTGLASYETALEDHRIGMFKYQTDYTMPGPAIYAFASQTDVSPADSCLEKATILMHALYRQFRYVQGVTGIQTTAEEAMALGEGVCQDYSHILLSLCRLYHIPARYVVGMLMGEGLSHAWVEICQDGRWIALDPTNNLIVDDQHIKISTGRDYRDCTINQGVFTGHTVQTQTVKVNVWEIS